jgi:hypothetical protein
MTTTQTRAVLRHIRGMVTTEHTNQLSDGEFTAEAGKTQELPDVTFRVTGGGGSGGFLGSSN